ETGFTVEQSVNEGPWELCAVAPDSPGIGTVTVEINGRKPGNDYFFRVRSLYHRKKTKLASDPSTASNELIVDEKLSPSDRPSVTTEDVGGILLSWSTSTSKTVRAVTILRKNKGGQFVPIAELPPGTTSYTDFDVLFDGTVYTYKVQLVNNFN